MSSDLSAVDDVHAQLQAALNALLQCDVQLKRREDLLAARDMQIAEMARIGAYRETRITALETQIA